MFRLACVADPTRSQGSRVVAATLLVTAIAMSVSDCARSSSASQAGTPVIPSGAPDRPIANAEVSTPPEMPPFRLSDEATSSELTHALNVGKAVRRQIEWVEREEAVASGEKAAGEYLITYLITPADDYYDIEAAVADLPAHHTTVLPGSAHVAVVIRDAADGRLVPGLIVSATLTGTSAGATKAALLPFGWHEILNRYGENVILPPSPFTLTVHITAPGYRRHDRVNGDRFRQAVTVRFADVSVSEDLLAIAAQRLARGDGHDALVLSREEGTAVALSLASALRDPDTKAYRRRSGDYDVALIIESARGFWQPHDGRLVYSAPDTSLGMVDHMEVSMRDATTGRAIPELNVRATILDSRKREIDTYVLPFMWHPWMNHYGSNVLVPGPGRYTVRLHAEAPAFRRYGSMAFRRFNRAVDVEMRNVQFLVPRT